MKRLRSNRAARLTALCLAVSLLFTAGCRKTDGTETTAAPGQDAVVTLPEGSITVPYTSLDTVNPFYTQSLLNAALVSLVYESLYYVDSGFMPVPLLSAGETATETTIQVALSDSAVFSDGAPLTAADVVYSFNAAKKAPLYRSALKSIVSCEEGVGRTVVFTLDAPDVNALNLLTFPIAKENTADRESDLPLGTGCYCFRNDGLRLSLACSLKRDPLPQIGTVRLYDVTDASVLMHLLNTGEIDCFYTDLADGTAKRSHTGAGEVYLNNLIYLGVNSDSYRLYLTDMRKAVSLAISRAGIAESAFLSHARSTVYPFNASWDALADADVPQTQKDADTVTAEAILKDLGAGRTGDTLHYTLIAREDVGSHANAARQIARDLSAVNIDVQVSLLNEEAYREALEDGEFDFYLGEIKLRKNMDLSAFFREDGGAAYGIRTEGSGLADRYGKYVAGEIGLKDFLYSFSEELPFIPLVFRNGQFCYSGTIKGTVECPEDRLFLNVADWQL